VEKIIFSATDEHHEQIRIDKFLSATTEQTRTMIQNLITEEQILVNNKPIKANYKLKEQDEISLLPYEIKALALNAEDLNLEIVYEDESLLFVNKRSGMVVHPAPGNYEHTLVNGLLHQVSDLSGINGVARPGIVHRIDKDTSGLLVVAKNDLAHQNLVDQLREKTMTRRYLLLVHGVIEEDEGTIDAPLGRNQSDRKKMAVTDHNGKNAVTHFKVLERFNDYTYVQCILETGRTHQIRVHMKYIGHALVGDPVYGPKKTIDTIGQALHAETLGLIHPVTKQYLEFSVELPAEFLKTMAAINDKSNKNKEKMDL